MPCFHPLAAFRTATGEVVWRESGRVDVVRRLELACGQCIGCRLERARGWAARCMHEAQGHELNSFVTLTYADPAPVSLEYRDFQLFMKRLRKAHSGRVRFFMCGEYGESNFRPHYHALLFGVGFVDRKRIAKTDAGFTLYRSAGLERLWPHGLSSVGDVSFESAGYVARYALKKVTGDCSAQFYKSVDYQTGEVTPITPEFCHMSLRPGIGQHWYQKYKSQTFPRDYVVVRGVRCNVPKYYKRLYDRESPLESEWLDYQREKAALERVADNTDERLAVKEQVLRATLSHLVRSI